MLSLLDVDNCNMVIKRKSLVLKRTLKYVWVLGMNDVSNYCASVCVRERERENSYGTKC